MTSCYFAEMGFGANFLLFMTKDNLTNMKYLNDIKFEKAFSAGCLTNPELCISELYQIKVKPLLSVSQSGDLKVNPLGQQSIAESNP